MGLFLTMLACKNTSRKEVVEAVIKLMGINNFFLESKEKVKQITGKNNKFEITNVQNGWVQIFCPVSTHNELAYSLSKNIKSSVFEFHIHDGAFWMYQLFSDGKLVDKFNPVPDYWSNISKKEKNKWAGNPSVISKIFDIPKSKIEPYLQFWKNPREESKAFPSDQFPIMNVWGMVDFQNKLGIIYPSFEKPETLDLIRISFKENRKK